MLSSIHLSRSWRRIGPRTMMMLLQPLTPWLERLLAVPLSPALLLFSFARRPYVAARQVSIALCNASSPETGWTSSVSGSFKLSATTNERACLPADDDPCPSLPLDRSPHQCTALSSSLSQLPPGLSPASYLFFSYGAPLRLSTGSHNERETREGGKLGSGHKISDIRPVAWCSWSWIVAMDRGSLETSRCELIVSFRTQVTDQVLTLEENFEPEPVEHRIKTS